jgi:hypothetical protein
MRDYYVGSSAQSTRQEEAEKRTYTRRNRDNRRQSGDTVCYRISDIQWVKPVK